MASRGTSSSQADPNSAAQNASFANDVNVIFNCDTTNLSNRPALNVPWPRPFNTPNSNAFSPNQQQNPNYQLPSLEGLLTEGRYDPFDSFQHLNSLNNYRHPDTSQPNSDNNYSRTVPRPGLVRTRPDITWSGLHSGPQRIFADQYFVAPPGVQQSRSSSAAQNLQTQLPQPNRSAPEPNSDDYYLANLADGNFSSPSLPPISSSPLPPTRPHSSNLPKPLEVGEVMPRVETRGPRSNKRRTADLAKEEPDLDSNSGIDPTTPAMPITRKRAATTTGESRAAATKRRRSSPTSPTSPRVTKSRCKPATNVSPFIDDEPIGGSANQDVHETIDLSNAADVPEELMASKCDNRIKIGKFQCVICMDDTSYLTVTHCGHLFCSECLHSALHIDNMKKTCPVCRTKVDPKEKKGKNQKSYYHLELKIMTANKKGKQPAGLP
ncbi:hypothetical protein F4804DRAFT_201926 [Jackrogersella minutella]|nr:hypothetical protein F4804DRAFT_201926 [Jackrogersella minutella]